MEGVGLVHGDVEIHLRQRDWQNHGHGTDPNYNGVVLHAALEVDPKPTNLQSGQPVPVISLQALLNEQEPIGPPPRSSLWAVLLDQGYTPPKTREEMGELLDQAGDARFRHKSSRFQLFLAEQPPDQALYEGLAEALGVSVDNGDRLMRSIDQPLKVGVLTQDRGHHGRAAPGAPNHKDGRQRRLEPIERG